MLSVWCPSHSAYEHPHIMNRAALVLLPLLALGIPSVNANVWTVDCSILTTQRMDPIIFPGQSPAGHVHAIVGASKFE